MVTIRRDASKNLRDICGDLRARVAMIEDVMAQEETRFRAKQDEAEAEHKTKMDGFKNALSGYRNMLILEEAFASASLHDSDDMVGPRPEVKITLPAQKAPLAEFFIAQVKERGPMTKEELRLAALFAGYFEEGDSGGRATHVTLSNINRSKRIGHADGRYYSVEETTESLL